MRRRRVGSREEFPSAALEELRGAVLDFLVSDEAEGLGEDSVACQGLRAFVKVVPELVGLREVEEEIWTLSEEFSRASESLGEIGGGLRQARAGIYGRVSGLLRKTLEEG